MSRLLFSRIVRVDEEKRLLYIAKPDPDATFVVNMDARGVPPMKWEVGTEIFGIVDDTGEKIKGLAPLKEERHGGQP